MTTRMSHLLVGLAVLFVAACSSLEPVHDVTDSPVPPGQTMAEVYDAIVEGGDVRGWKIRQTAPGHAVGTIFVRSHVAEVDIYYDTETYSIEYRSSDNLEYEDGEIHGNYNEWVTNLDGDIQRAFRY